MQLLQLFTYLGAKGGLSEEQKATLGFPVTPRLGAVPNWTFDPEHKTGHLVLSKRNKTATNAQAFYSCVLGTMDFKTGIHAFRVHIIRSGASRQWILIGVSERKHFPDNNSYSDTSLHGVTSCNNLYKAGAATACSSVMNDGDYVDCKINLHTNMVFFRGNTWASEIATPIPPHRVYCAHFIVYQNNEIDMEPISPIRYGKF